MRHPFRNRWKRFRPRHRRGRRVEGRFKYRDKSFDRSWMSPRENVPFVCNSSDFYDCAEEEVVSLLQRRPEVNAFDSDIDRLRARFMKSRLAHDGQVALLAQVPRAILAQLQIDKLPGGYRDRETRLYELIDFNDTLVATILVMNDEQRAEFDVRTKQSADRICKRVGAPSFSNDQWSAIIRGLTREVAVYRAAKDSGFNVFMPDRVFDALGIDVQVQDPETGRYINIDVKTPSSFRRRLEQLVHEGRLTEEELLEADAKSYVVQRNGHGRRQVSVVVLCILPDLFGDFGHWKLLDDAPMRDMLNMLIREHGLNDRKFGRYLV